MKKTFFLITVFFCTSSYAQGPVTITEKMIPKLVRSGNPLVMSERKKVNSFEAKTGFLKRSFIPKARIQVGQESFKFKYGRDEFESGPYYQAGIDINLYNGGKDSLNEDTNKLNVKIANSNKEISIYSQIEDARKTFWNALYLKHVVAQLEEGLVWVNNNKKAALKRIKSGVATNSDKFEFEIKNVEIKQDIERAKLLLQKQLNHLKILVGLSEEATIQLGQTLTHDHDWQQLISHSEEEHSYLLETDKLSIEKFQLKSKLAGRQWLPSIDGYAVQMRNNRRLDYEPSDNLDRSQTVFGLMATWTFTDFIEGNIQKQSATALADSTKYRLQYNKRKIENELHMELKELELLDKLVHDADENVDRSKKFFKLISIEYKRGVKTSGDMLLATEKLVNSHVRKMAIVRDLQIAKAHVMRKLKK